LARTARPTSTESSLSDADLWIIDNFIDNAVDIDIIVQSRHYYDQLPNSTKNKEVC